MLDSGHLSYPCRIFVSPSPHPRVITLLLSVGELVLAALEG